MTYLFFLNTPYNNILSSIDNHLPEYISKYETTICFDHPQFLRSFYYLIKNKKIFEQITPSFYIYHSIGFFPFGRKFKLLNRINYYLNLVIFKHFIKDFNFWHNSLEIISFTPELIYILPRISNINKIIYYVTDEYTAMSYWASTLELRQFKCLEKKLLNICNQVIVTSNTLLDKYRRLHSNAILFSIPSHSSVFIENKPSDNIIPQDIKNIPHPIAGFIGTYNDWKIDTNFLIKLIRSSPNVSFVFLGLLSIRNPFLYNQLLQLKNFYFLGVREINELPSYVSKFDVCLIPYRDDNWGKSAYPVKIMEYLAMGKPVITTAIPSIKYLRKQGIIYWSKNNTTFINNLNKALKEKISLELVRRRKSIAMKNDWSLKINTIKKILSKS